MTMTTEGERMDERDLKHVGAETSSMRRRHGNDSGEDHGEDYGEDAPKVHPYVAVGDPWDFEKILDAWGKYTVTGSTRLGLVSVRGNTYSLDDMMQVDYWVESIQGWRKCRQVMVHVYGRGGSAYEFPYEKFGMIFGAALSKLDWVDIAAEIARAGGSPRELVAPTLLARGRTLVREKALAYPFTPTRLRDSEDPPPMRRELEAYERAHGHPHPYWGPSQDYQEKKGGKG
jgi:hypothetical protein